MFSTAPPPKSPGSLSGPPPPGAPSSEAHSEGAHPQSLDSELHEGNSRTGDARDSAAAGAPFDAARSFANGREANRQVAPSALEFELYVGPAGAILGKLSFVGAARIDGRVDGELFGGEAVVVGPTANVRGTIRARHVIVLGGVVEARIVALESVELCGTAKVHGDVTAPRVEMEQHVEYVGRCEKRPLEAHELG